MPKQGADNELTMIATSAATCGASGVTTSRCLGQRAPIGMCDPEHSCPQRQARARTRAKPSIKPTNWRRHCGPTQRDSLNPRHQQHHACCVSEHQCPEEEISFPGNAEPPTRIHQTDATHCAGERHQATKAPTRRIMHNNVQTPPEIDAAAATDVKPHAGNERVPPHQPELAPGHGRPPGAVGLGQTTWAEITAPTPPLTELPAAARINIHHKQTRCATTQPPIECL